MHQRGLKLLAHEPAALSNSILEATSPTISCAESKVTSHGRYVAFQPAIWRISVFLLVLGLRTLTAVYWFAAPDRSCVNPIATKSQALPWIEQIRTDYAPACAGMRGQREQVQQQKEKGTLMKAKRCIPVH